MVVAHGVKFTANFLFTLYFSMHRDGISLPTGSQWAPNSLHNTGIIIMLRNKPEVTLSMPFHSCVLMCVEARAPGCMAVTVRTVIIPCLPLPGCAALFPCIMWGAMPLLFFCCTCVAAGSGAGRRKAVQAMCQHQVHVHWRC